MKKELKCLIQDDIKERGESSIIDICEIITDECSIFGNKDKTWIERQCWKKLKMKFHEIMGTYLRVRG